MRIDGLQVENNYTNPLTGKHIVNSIKPLDLNSFSKEDLLAYFENSFDLYETLFTSLVDDSVYYLCPDRLRLPLIFYYGHTAAVFINKLVLANLIQPNDRVNLEYETTFETGVDEMSWDDTEHYRMGGDYKWPRVENVKEYRSKVRDLIYDLIERTNLNLPVTWDDQSWAFFMGFEHERIHYETSTVLIRQYPIHMVKRPLKWKYGPFKLEGDKEFLQNSMIKVKETQVRIGKSFDFPSYGWDNEYGQVDCKVSAFEASKFKITNEEFLEFVMSKGYEKQEFWSTDGWQWVQYKQAKHPLFWICPMNCKSGCGGKIGDYSHCKSEYFNEEQIKFFTNDSLDKNNNINKQFPYKFRLMFDIVDMPSNWPVEVNFHEAKAFCNWKGKGYRMLTEAEHHAIRDNEIFELSTDTDVIYASENKCNHNMLYGSSTPVNMFPANSKGFYDVFGNVWEWCEDNFNGLPGGKTHYLYDDFSSPCYDGRHNMIMGGSWASTGDEASRFARFMFRRHFYQHCGFRLARSLSTRDGSKPNPQVRLVKDRIFVLGASFPENKSDLDSSLVEVNYYETTNSQYLYDSHLHPELLENELKYNYIENNWFDPMMQEINNLIYKHNVNNKIATHIGCSTGNIVFELCQKFENVIGVDFCGRFLDIAERLRQTGRFETVLSGNQSINVDLTENKNKEKAIFKQMTWIPNEIPKSDLVIFTMIDRCVHPIPWLKRFREITSPEGILIIQSQNSKYGPVFLAKILNEFNLIQTTSISNNDSFTVWKLKN